MVHLIEANHNQEVIPEDQGSVTRIHAASSTTHLQPGQGAIGEIITTNDHSVQSALVIQQVAVEQTQVPANNNPLIPGMNNTLTKEQRDNMQREVIFNYLADGLKQLIVNQRVSGASGLRGSLSIPSSLIKIDLSGLGINSISISVNAPAQNNVMNAVTAPSIFQLNEASESSLSLLSLQDPVAAPYKSTTSISKVYYRKKLKNKTKALEKQITEMEPTPEHAGNAFPDFPEEFGATLPMQVPTLVQPVIIDTSALFAQQNEVYIPNGMEIVPWKPTGEALTLQVFAATIEHQSTVNKNQQASRQSSTSTFEQDFELEAQAPQPSLITCVYKRRPKPKSSTMSLPTIASIRSPATLVVDKMARRSTRLSANKGGFREIRVDKEPSKRRKTLPVVIDEATGQAGPIPLFILQGWGVKCGVAPGELTEDALLQAPTTNLVINEYT
jgi:hypothetical protein